MIKLMRIDDRLIHGQVACYWVNASGADTIVVANDRYATNAMLKMTLTVGKPAGVVLKVLTLHAATNFIETHPKAKILLIVEGSKDALHMIENTKEDYAVNIGGIRFAPDQGKVSISNQVFLNEKEINELKQIKELTQDIYLQEAPSKSKMSLQEIEEIFKKS